MDQVTSLYEELIAYEPSLIKDKEMVLQLIQKMIDVKPHIAINPQWKENFDKTLAAHIAQSGTTRVSHGSWFMKWSFSIVSFSVFAVVAWASYWFLASNAIKHKIPKPPLAVVDAQPESWKNEAADMNMPTSTHTNRTIAKDQISLWEVVATTLTSSVDIDSTEIDKTQEVNTFATSLMSMDSWEELAPDKMLAKVADVSSGVNTEKMIALLFVDETWILADSSIKDVLHAEAVPATFVEWDHNVATQLQASWYEVLPHTPEVASFEIPASLVVDPALIEKKLDESIENIWVIVLPAIVAKNPEIVKVVIHKLRAKGYIFVPVSAIQK